MEGATILEQIKLLLKTWAAGGLVDKLFSTLITLVVGILAVKLVLRLLNRALEKSKLEKAAYSLILSLAKVGLYTLLGLSLAGGLGIDVTGVVAMASVLTLAVSLALQNMLTNILGGFSLLTTHPFHSGDYVDIGGQSGTVTQIDMTYTRLLTADNKMVCIPNSTVLASEVVNYTASGTRRGQIQVGAGYEAPTQKVLDALVLADSTGRVHPLCGVFHRRTLPAIRRQLEHGERRVLDLLPHLRWACLSGEVPDRVLYNLNMPEDLLRLSNVADL